MAKILVVEDDRNMRLLTAARLEDMYTVVCANDGIEAMEEIHKGGIDLIIADIMMPRMDGITMTMRLRESYDFPVIMLSAKSEDTDKILGLNIGADDYITKPFSLDELGARVSAHLRRDMRLQKKSDLKFNDDLVIDYSSKAVYFKDKEISFSKTEFDIIELLSTNAGIVFDKERIYERLWGFDSDGYSMTVVEHIRKIRAKFTEAGCKSYIATVWGCGYKWEN